MFKSLSEGFGNFFNVAKQGSSVKTEIMAGGLSSNNGI